MAELPIRSGDKPTFAELPSLSYDELTVLLSALADQVRRDRELLQVASSNAIAGLALERINIGRSLITACLEARARTDRFHGGPLEPLRVVWEQPETTTSPWADPPRVIDPLGVTNTERE